MRSLLGLFVKIALVGAAIFLLAIAALVGLIVYFGRPLSDDQVLRALFGPKFPGYSAIRILERRGERTVEHPRVLVVEVVMENYSGQVTCQGEANYIKGDPSFLSFGWYDWACTGHSMLVAGARQALFEDTDQSPAHCDVYIEDIALVLKRWVESGWIDIDQIRTPSVRARVSYLIEHDVPTHKPAMLFDVSTARVHDLAPELPAGEKLSIYVLRCNGSLDVFLTGPKWWGQPLGLGIGDIILPTPVKRPSIQP
ncbi:MAG: hypothetical protein N2508_07765 [Anaerolineae bacterium]|nr:hypothetical protein [Anaerolineae bacterium]